LIDIDGHHLGLTGGKYGFAKLQILLPCARSCFDHVFCKILGWFTPFDVLVYRYVWLSLQLCRCYLRGAPPLVGRSGVNREDVGG
jgi:hypothetical protein